MAGPDVEVLDADSHDSLLPLLPRSLAGEAEAVGCDVDGAESPKATTPRPQPSGITTNGGSWLEVRSWAHPGISAWW